LDAPCKYPAGLATDGRNLFLLDWRQAEIYQINPAGGKLQPCFAAPTLKPHGLAYADGRLFISDDHSGWVYELNLATGRVENRFEAPGSSPTGLAWAGDALFVLERKSGQIYKVLPQDGTILACLPAPNESCTGLTYDGQHLWVSDRVKNELYMVDPQTGMVLGILDAPGPYAAGLAWLDGYLWNVDFQTRKLYQIIVADDPPYRLSQTRQARVEYLWTLYNYGPGQVEDLTVSLAIPEELPAQQLLSQPEYSIQPTGFAVDRWGQRCAVFQLGSLPAGSKQAVSYSLNVRLSAIRYLVLPEKVGSLEDIPADIRRLYTADESRYRINTPFIRETVQRVVGQEKNPYWIARKIFNYVIQTLEYEMAGGWDVPEVVLQRGKGSCSEYTFAFIALCRAAGLPARYQGSVVVRGDDASVDEAFHRWAQVYLPGYGWVPVDANRGDAKAPADQARGFGELANRFLITTHGGGGSEYLDWGYNSQARYRTTGQCKIEEENLGFWEPLTPAENPPTESRSQSAECKRS